MIKFFRGFRSQLLSENKFSRYLIYACGEIVLVMVGILLAIQVNNWNENRKARITLNAKLESLILSLESDRSYLINFEESLRFKITSLQHLLKLSGVSQVNLEEHFPGIELLFSNNSTKNNGQFFWNGPYPDTLDRKFIEMVFKESGISRFTGLNSAVYDELTSTGWLSQIKNDSLTTSLRGYYVLFEQEYNERYFTAINKWRETLKEHGALFFDIQQIQNPLKLINESPKFSAEIRELIYDSAWIEALINSRIGRIDVYIAELRREINKPQ